MISNKLSYQFISILFYIFVDKKKVFVDKKKVFVDKKKVFVEKKLVK